MQALIRVDASTQIGSGHLFRCLTLARALRSHGASVAFACMPLGEKLASVVVEEGFKLISLHIEASEPETNALSQPLGKERQAADARATLEQVSSLGAHTWMIVDHYGLDETWEAIVRERFQRMLVIDDLANRKHSCDLLLDQSELQGEEARYRRLVNADARLLLGPEYALLRDEFAQERLKSRPRNGEIDSVLVSFGGADPTGETIKAVSALRRIDGLSGGIDVIGGAANPRVAQLEELCRHDRRVRFHSTTTEMAKLMAGADLSIGACGSTSWERCALFLPALVIITAENQRKIARSLATTGAAYNLGWHEDVIEKDIADGVTMLCESRDLVGRMSRMAGTLVDGGGTQRVVREMENVYARARTLH